MKKFGLAALLSLAVILGMYYDEFPCASLVQIALTVFTLEFYG